METKREKFGFTLVELLTVMSVIAILIGVLVPALNLVRKMAKDTSQKAQFHSISVSLDIYNGEMGEYPESAVKGTSAPYTTGAQRLAEALVGRDMLGFDPMTSWDADKDNGVTTGTIPYASKALGDPGTEETKSLNRRKGPYLNPEKIEAHNVGDLYKGLIGAGDVYDGIANNKPAPVLTDIYRVKDVTIGSKTVKAGSPVLYYRANTSLTGSGIFPNTQIGGIAFTSFGATRTETQGYIYDSLDNEDLLALGDVATQLKLHHFDGLTPYIDAATTENGRWIFYDTITNSKITSLPRPYNASSYLLISAGYDGIYGTTDDITNFEDAK
ncbi:MAG: type II secretion system protein [Sedimentisphaerales bacterium]